MDRSDNTPVVPPTLLADWVSARSLVRGLPMPVACNGGLLVETASPDETRRYVFAGPVPAIAALAASITSPRIFIKMCGPGEQLLALLPPRWQLMPASYLMTHEGAAATPPASPLPPGYRLELAREQATTAARIIGADGTLAASGYASAYGAVFIFDRIVVDPAHQRRGLGTALMAALASTQPAPPALRVLVATEAGRRLYQTLGWRVHAPYSSAVIAA